MALVIRAPYPDAGGGMRAWVPTDAATQPVSWFDPKDSSTMTMSGGLISQLRSKVGTVVANASGGLQPTYNGTARNGLPGVVFNGGTAMTLNSVATFPAGKAASTVAVVGYGSGTASNQTFFAHGGGLANSAQRVIGYNNNNANDIWISNVGAAEFSTPPKWYQLDHAVIAEQPTGDNPTIMFSVDGVSGMMSTSGVVDTGSSVGFLGQLDDNFGRVTGTLQEQVLYPGNLTSDDRSKLQGYLAWNNNQQGNLPSGHPYKSAPPMVPA